MKKHIMILFLSMTISGCSVLKVMNRNSDQGISVKRISLMINDSLRIPSLKNKETGVLTFANLNRLDKAEPLGRYLQEKTLHHLFENGFRIKELRLGKETQYIPETGEINLTRLKKALKESGYAKLASIIVGTYIDAGDHFYVSAKLVELKNGLIRASGEMKIYKNKYIKNLTGYSGDPGSDIIYERKPVPPSTYR